MPRHRVDAKSAAVGIPLAVYLTVLGLSALWFHSLLQPRYLPNPGLAVYTPPPGTVISDEGPVRLLAHHWQAPAPAEIESEAEEPKTAVVESKPDVESKPERTIELKEPKRPKARERDNPLRHYAASPEGYGGNRHSNHAAAYPGYSGNRPF